MPEEAKSNRFIHLKGVFVPPSDSKMCNMKNALEDIIGGKSTNDVVLKRVCLNCHRYQTNFLLDNNFFYLTSQLENAIKDLFKRSFNVRLKLLVTTREETERQFFN